MIERRTVGNSGLQVSALSLGTMTFARTGPYARIAASEHEMARLVDAACDLGIDTFDTANVYGAGESEEVLGRLLAPRRSSVVVATKVRFPSESHGAAQPPAGTYGLSRHAIIRAVEASLRRLKSDYVDLLQFHMQDRTVPIEETLRATDDLITSGKVRYVGVSNYMTYRLVESLWVADRRNLEPPVSLQAPWSLLNRDIERELVLAARRFRLGVLAYSPLARGFLSGKYRPDADPPPGSRLAEWRDELAACDQPRTWRILDAVRAIAHRRGTLPSVVALAWLLARRPVASVILGARNEAQLRENAQAADLRLSAPETTDLDQVSEPQWGYPCDFIKRFEPW